MDFLLNILSHWESALAVLLVLGGLIFFHELGHFAVARLFRIGVRTFSLGFGPKLLKLRRGKTDYCLSLIPLGGYVALAGEEDEAEQPDPKGKEIDGVLFAPEELYSGRPAWHRLLVVLAGPVANFVLALIIYCGIAWAQGQTYLLPEVGDVTPGTPAATAGILPGDRVLSIDGKPIENWNAVAEGIGAGNGKPVCSFFVQKRDHRHIPMAVGICFHDRHHCRVFRLAFHQAIIVPQCAKVHLSPTASVKIHIKTTLLEFDLFPPRFLRIHYI